MLAYALAMNESQLLELLYTPEGNTVDFKEQQYRFVKASDDQKSELLKDILGFVNCWRQSEAFILIGVKERVGGMAEIVGIQPDEHLADHSLQQFVNNLTDQPARFSYEAIGFDGKQVGVIRIALQPRPICLKRDYGKLRRNEVYVRRGSSTDPTKPALPREIAQMGATTFTRNAALEFGFASSDRSGPLGTDIAFECEWCEMPASELIPDLREPSTFLPGLGSIRTGVSIFHNKDFFRDVAHFEQVRRLCRGYRIWIRNAGDCVAARVRIELVISDECAVVMGSSEMPSVPTEDGPQDFVPIPEQIASALGRRAGEADVIRDKGRISIDIDFGDLQPGREAHSNVLYFGRKTSGPLVISGRAFSDSLPIPKAFNLRADVAVTTTSLSVKDLVRLDLPAESD